MKRLILSLATLISHFTLTLIEADKFLASLGWLKGPPTLTPPAQ